MRKEPVEIFSDASNAAILRHPGRNFPGVLVQGDTLHTLIESLSVVQRESASLSEDAAGELEGVVERLGELLEHYKSVLVEHKIPLPFYEKSRASQETPDK